MLAGLSLEAGEIRCAAGRFAALARALVLALRGHDAGH